MHVALLVLGAVSLALWLGILLAPPRPWDLRPVAEDEPEPAEPARWPSVCAVVPARNEAHILPRTLPALRAQDYPGPFRVVVVDDRSGDGTAEAARAAGAEVVAGAPLPDGWVGKVWALEQGSRAAGEEPDYLLLTDADILHAPGSLRRLVAESEAAGLALNSRMALLHARSGWERLLVPPFVLFFNLLYPMRRVNDPRRRTAAAAGGCVLLRAPVRFEQIRGAIIDDVSLAREVKRAGGRLRLAVSRADVVSLREHESLGALRRMVRRTAFVQLRRSWALLGLALVGLALLFPVPLLLLAAVAYEPRAAALGALAWLVSSLVYRRTVRFYGLGSAWSWTLPLAGTLYGVFTLDSALRGGGDW